MKFDGTNGESSVIYPRPFPITVSSFVYSLLSDVPPAAEQFQKQGISEGKAWTRAVKTVLEDLGKLHQCRSIFTDREKGMSEFMLDLVWWSLDGDGAILGCECEWGNTRYSSYNPQAVADDFDKLLSFKAPLKLMIFDSYNDSKIRTECIDKLDWYLREYRCHIQGEAYLLIDFCAEPQCWSATIRQDGMDHSLSFEPLVQGEQ